MWVCAQMHCFLFAISIRRREAARPQPWPPLPQTKKIPGSRKWYTKKKNRIDQQYQLPSCSQPDTRLTDKPKAQGHTRTCLATTKKDDNNNNTKEISKSKVGNVRGSGRNVPDDGWQQADIVSFAAATSCSSSCFLFLAHTSAFIYNSSNKLLEISFFFFAARRGPAG